jgi:hypothetical protein
MQLLPVSSKKTARQFLDVARVIYKDDPNWICPLDSDINKIFNPGFNRNFGQGEANRWILKDDSGRLFGRIAAFYHTVKSYRYDYPVGGIGFFECIEDKTAAFLLFDSACTWLVGKGMKAADGPVNFGENDNFWGLLVEGFTPPAFGMNYHKPYYRKFFEDYGFQPYYTQITKHLDLNIPFPERFWKIAEWVMRKPGFSYRHFSYDQLDKFVGDILEIHALAWSQHENYSPLDRDLVYREFRRIKPILIEDFIWFVYHNENPVAFLVMLPDVNQILRHFKGRMNWANRLRFLYYKWNKEIQRTRITIMGVVPAYQGMGIESAIFWHLQEPVLVKRTHIREIEISWVGDYNPKMRSTLEAIGANPGKKHITYRKMFDQGIKFQTARVINPAVKVK